MQVTRDKLLHDADQVEYLVSKGHLQPCGTAQWPTRPALPLALKAAE